MNQKTAPTYADNGHSFTATFAAATSEKKPEVEALQLTETQLPCLSPQSSFSLQTEPDHTPVLMLWDQFVDTLQNEIQAYNLGFRKLKCLRRFACLSWPALIRQNLQAE